MGRRRGGDKLFQRNKEKSKKDFSRLVNDMSLKNDIIIACEDSISSPTYFQMIINELIAERKITQDSIVIVPHDGNTHPTGVLSNLKSYTNTFGKTYKDFTHKWIVIDRDYEGVNGGGHTAEDFNNALSNAKSKKSNLNIEVAYANDAFELWYLLHFEYRTTPISRDVLLKLVIKRLKKSDPYKFSKLNKENIKQSNYTKYIYDVLLPLQKRAILNARKLLSSYGDDHNPERDNPSTTIHRLVDILNNIKNEKIEK